MTEYKKLVQTVLSKGTWERNRTGIDTLSYFAYSYKIDISKRFPLLTTKRMNFLSVLYEVLWYLSGEHHIQNLRKHTGIWNEWADENGNLSSSYGRFWRDFPLPDVSQRLPGESWYWNTSIDQVQMIISALKRIRKFPDDPARRRLVLTAWHPGNAWASRLSPCHLLAVWNVIGDQLNCHLTQRSADIALGVPYNIAGYAILTYIFCRVAGYRPGIFAHTLVDAHIYENHIDSIIEQIKRPAMLLPKLLVADKTIDGFNEDDFTLLNYRSHPFIKYEVAV